jgi:hypothetical protein
LLGESECTGSRRNAHLTPRRLSKPNKIHLLLECKIKYILLEQQFSLLVLPGSIVSIRYQSSELRLPASYTSAVLSRQIPHPQSIDSTEGLITHQMSTSTQQSWPSDSLALVNSFYGPGATLSWYLTCLSCLISWTLHPKKRLADTITGNLITHVTFPTVASAHLITQIRSWPPESSVNEQTLAQLRASLAASLTITEIYLSLCIILLLPGLFARSPKRLCLLAITGVFCLLSETYLYFAHPSVRYQPGNFERFFLIDSLPLLVLISVLASVLVGLLLAYIYILFSEIRSEPVAETTSPADDADTVDDHGLKNKPTKSTGLDRLARPSHCLVGCQDWGLVCTVLLMRTTSSGGGGKEKT